MPVTNEMGYILNTVSHKLVPIHGIDELDIERAQDWKFDPLGIQSSTAAVWQGSPAVEFNLNFELLAGYGRVDTRQTLRKMAMWFHAMAAHQKSSGGKASGLAEAPPPVYLEIYGVVKSLGFMKNVRTSLQGPWASGSDAETGFAYFPTLVRFSGTFVFIPGANPKDGGVQVDLNNEFLAMKNVENNFYSYGG